MADLSALSVDEIRMRYLEANRPTTSQLLNELSRDARQGVRRIYQQLKRRHDAERKERLRLDAMLNFERILWKSGKTRVAGVDEAGMAPLAGPVIAAAVVFTPYTEISGIDDSKRLDPERREALADAIRNSGAQIGIGRVEPQEIDQLNIYRAGLEAMRRAVLALPSAPEHILVDARHIPEICIPQNPFNRGDGINYSIAAASIIAKTHRDRIMLDLDAVYPGYGFAQHKGYPTAVHQEACRRLGLSPVHRRSFSFLREVTGKYSALFYELKTEVQSAHSVDALTAAEEHIKHARQQLNVSEYRKLRLMLTRRWKTSIE